MTARQNETPEDRAIRLAKNKQWRKDNPDYHAAYVKKHAYRIKKYGLTQDDYDAMLQDQRGACAICNEPMDKPHVDHNHTTGKVRGLLCQHCNMGLGHFRDSPLRLRLASAYLEKE